MLSTLEKPSYMPKSVINEWKLPIDWFERSEVWETEEWVFNNNADSDSPVISFHDMIEPEKQSSTYDLWKSLTSSLLICESSSYDTRDFDEKCQK